MTFKVKDLMISVPGPVYETEPSTCTGWTRPTGGACVDSLLDHSEDARHGLSVLKDQLQQVMARA